MRQPARAISCQSYNSCQSHIHKLLSKHSSNTPKTITKVSQSKTSQSLSKQQRLRLPQQFQDVYKSKQWGGSNHHTFNVLAPLPLARRGQARFGVTVSKKVSNLAVQRNRIKRQVREFYRHHQTELIPVDLVITAKPSCAKASDEDRLKSLELLWQKILKWQRWYKKSFSDNEFC